MTPRSEYLEASEPTRRERAENWRVAIGLQKVDGLVVIPVEFQNQYSSKMVTTKVENCRF